MPHSNLTLVAISLLCTLGLSGCDKPGSAEQAGKSMDDAVSKTGKQVDATYDKYESKVIQQGAESAQVWADTEVTTKVKTKLFGEPGLKSLQISVDTVGGVVTLTGTADSQANSDRASAIAMAVDGVENVVNQLTLAAAQ